MAIRFMVTSEYEAIQLYMQLAESTENKLSIAVLKDIADEEIVHVGEFLELLSVLAQDEKNHEKVLRNKMIEIPCELIPINTPRDVKKNI